MTATFPARLAALYELTQEAGMAPLDEFEPDAEAALAAYETINEIRRILAIIRDEVEKKLLPTLTGYKTETAVGVIERMTNTKRTHWRHDELAPQVYRTLLADPLEGDSELIDRVTRVLVEKFPAGYSWRTGRESGLPSLGFDPADWCDERKDGHTVKVTADTAQALKAVGVASLPTKDNHHE